MSPERELSVGENAAGELSLYTRTVQIYYNLCIITIKNLIITINFIRFRQTFISSREYCLLLTILIKIISLQKGLFTKLNLSYTSTHIIIDSMSILRPFKLNSDCLNQPFQIIKQNRLVMCGANIRCLNGVRERYIFYLKTALCVLSQ